MRVTFIDIDGETHAVEGTEDESAMRCATEHLVPGIIGECGGAMACATCHGYVDTAWVDRLPPPGAQERDMLAGCIDVRPNSRLTCQIKLTEALDGLKITVPESQT
jgi:ferredoxin, 2Fe-2S